MELNSATREKLAHSLTASTSELLPYLPYLLQDIDELGASVAPVLRLLKEHTIFYDLHILELACGKGTVAVALAKEAHALVLGVDLIPEFIEAARAKTERADLSHRCRFKVADANAPLEKDGPFDVTMLLAGGSILGGKKETLQKLKSHTVPGGFILLDESYLKTENQEVRYPDEGYCTLSAFDKILEELGLRQVAAREVAGDAMAEKNQRDLAAIEKRAAQLSEQYPEKKALFQGYVQNQKAEIEDIETGLINLVQLIRRID